MDFNFTDEQTQLADGLKRFISKECSFEERKKIIHSATGESDKVSRGLVDLGLYALIVPEEFGGLGGTPIDMLVVMQEFGRGLIIGPYFANFCGAEILKRSGNESQKTMLSDLAEGKLRLSVALEEKQSRYEGFNVETTAVQKGQDYILNGRKCVVLSGATADYLIVSARVSGDTRSTEGISLFLVPANAAGISRKDYRTVDNMRASDVTLQNVTVASTALLGDSGKAWPIIEFVQDYATMLLCAEAIGAMEAICAQTTDYTKTRVQFGQPISKFQVLQHRMVDMFIQLEQARSMAYLAAVKISSNDVKERRRIISAVKVRVGQAARFVGQQAIQTHGGMGMSDELAVSHYFKRLTAIELSLGDTDFHLQRFMSNAG